MSVVLPLTVGDIETLRCTPTEAGEVAMDLRSVAASLEDVQSRADRAAAPVEWSGAAAEAAHHAGTHFARRAAVAQEALQLATVAATRFEDRLVRLRHRRGFLNSDRESLNHAINSARQQVRDQTLTGPAAEERARHLRVRAAEMVADIAVWERDVGAAETDFIAALQGIDTVGEGRRTAETTPLPEGDGLLRHLRRLIGDVAALHRWWFSLSVAQRQAMMVAYPGVIGSTTGIPITGRDRANRAGASALRALLRQRDRDGRSTPLEKRALANLDALGATIDQYRHDVDPVSGRDLFKVIDYDPFAYHGDGSSVVSLGNPDTAGSVQTYTPGFSTHGGSLDGLGQVDDLYHDLRGRAGGDVATILWDEYDAPDLDHLGRDVTDPDPGPFDSDLHDAQQVLSPRDGQLAGHRLAGFLDGLDVTRYHPDPTITVIGHSYGSEVAQYAAHDGGHMSNVVLLADPGAPGHDVHDLVGNSGIHVYVAADDNDPVSLLGKGPLGGPGTLGADPAAATYGATRIDAPAGPDDVGGVLQFGNHSADHYLHPDDVGIHNVTAISAGDSPTVVDGRDSGNYHSLNHVVADAAESGLPGPVRGLVHVTGAVAHGFGQTPAGAALHTAVTHIPDGVEHDAAVVSLDGVSGLAHVVDGGAHDLDVLVEGGGRIPGPAGGLLGGVGHQLDAITPQLDGATHKVDALVSTVKGLL